MDLTYECTDFPEAPRPEILRADVLDLIDEQFAGDVKLLVLDGAEGIGKTTVCAQFAHRHADRTISLFIRPTTRLVVDPGYLRLELARQVYAALSGQPIGDQPIAEGFIRSGLASLQRRARQKREPFFFVVDGIADLQPGDAYVKEAVLQELIPWPYEWFRFLLTGNAQEILAFVRMPPTHQSTLIGRLHPNETREFFKDITEDKRDIEIILSVSRGIPSTLAQLYRILKHAAEPHEVLADLQNRAPNLFQMEWRSVDRGNKAQRFLLAVLAHDRRTYSSTTLGAVCRMDAGEVERLLSPLTFINIDSTTRELRFASEPHRRYAAEELRSLEPAVNTRIIDSLLEARGEEEALISLPAYFEKTGRHNELLDFLGGDHIGAVMERTHSLAIVRRRVRLGSATAKRLRHHSELMRFSMHNAVIQELSGVDIWGAEVAALASVGDYASAISVAQNAVLQEDALHLTAIIARAQAEQGRRVDPELLDQIQTLFDQIEPAELGNRAVEIACDLAVVAPELATQLVERAAQTRDRPEDPHALDIAFTRLVLSASLAESADAQRGDDPSAQFRTRIQSHALRALSDAVSLMTRNTSGAQVIARVEAMDRVSDRIYVLRHWTVTNAASPDALSVAEYGLKLVVQAGTYSSNARIFRQFATPLLYATEKTAIEPLARLLNVHASTIEAAGPTTDYVRFQLALAVAESRYDQSAAERRLMDLYEYVRPLSNLYTRAESTAWFLDTMQAIDVDGGIERALGLPSALAEDLTESIEQLLQKSADHYEAAKHVVRALAVHSLPRALEIVNKLNTEPRRDAVLDEIIESAMQVPDSELTIEAFNAVLDAYVNPDMLDSAVTTVCERLARIRAIVPTVLKNFPSLLNRIKCIRGLPSRCRASGYAVTFLRSQDAAESQVAPLLEWQKQAWQQMEPGWKHQLVAFNIAREIARHDVPLAQEYIRVAHSERSSTAPESSVPLSVFMMSLQLAIRAWTGLLQTHKTVEESLGRISRTIDRIQSTADRAWLYADLATRCGLNNRPADCRRLVLEHVDPLIRALGNDVTELEETLIRAAPALYFTYHEAFLDRLACLNPIDLDRALANTCDAILRRVPSGEPFERGHRRGYLIEHPDLLKVVSLLPRMNEDALIYYYICAVCDSISDGSVTKITREQANEYPDRLLDVVARKFPNPRFIKHEGFAIAAKAQISRIRPVTAEVWDDLICSANTINNSADQAYILGVIASVLPLRERTRRRELYNSARDLIQTLPASVDKTSRYADLAEFMLDSPDLSRECLRDAMTACLKSDDETFEDQQRRIVDIAYRMDPDFAASLASLADPDPAKRRKRSEIEGRIETLKLRGRLGTTAQNSAATLRDPNLPNAAWMKLGSLNADPLISTHLDNLTEIAEAAGFYPLRDAYSILSWLIQNAVVRFRADEIAASRLTPIFEATLSSRPH
jgi:hypothetical protein